MWESYHACLGRFYYSAAFRQATRQKREEPLAPARAIGFAKQVAGRPSTGREEGEKIFLLEQRYYYFIKNQKNISSSPSSSIIHHPSSPNKDDDDDDVPLPPRPPGRLRVPVPQVHRLRRRSRGRILLLLLLDLPPPPAVVVVVVVVAMGVVSVPRRDARIPSTREAPRAGRTQEESRFESHRQGHHRPAHRGCARRQVHALGDEQFGCRGGD